MRPVITSQVPATLPFKKPFSCFFFPLVLETQGSKREVKQVPIETRFQEFGKEVVLHLEMETLELRKWVSPSSPPIQHKAHLPSGESPYAQAKRVQARTPFLFFSLLYNFMDFLGNLFSRISGWLS